MVRLASQEIPSLLWNPKAPNRDQENTLTVLAIHSQVNSIHTLLTPTDHFNITLQPAPVPKILYAFAFPILATCLAYIDVFDLIV
jgi:hypothetical protein